MPRAKRSKQYRKLMQQFTMSFGFREPYQVLVDADFLLEANKCKMDIVRRLEDTLHARELKPMISQCSMRHLYGRKAEGPAVDAAIDQAKNQFERRFCGHRPDEYPEPLSAFDCISSCVDPKRNGVNKFNYVCAINDEELRASLRHVAGVPLLYIRKSVLIMEPMANISAKVRSREEKSKFRAEIKAPAGKRKYEDSDSDADDNTKSKPPARPAAKKQRKIQGPKQPNPLSVKKKKKETGVKDKGAEKPEISPESSQPAQAGHPDNAGPVEATKKKRKRKPKNKNKVTTGETADGPTGGAVMDGQSD